MEDTGQGRAQALVGGSEKGRAQASAEGSEQGRAQALVGGSEKGRAQASVEGSEQGRAQALVGGSEKGRAQASVEGSEQGRAQASVGGSEQGRAQALVGGSKQGRAQDSVQDIEQDVVKIIHAQVQIQLEISEVDQQLKGLKISSEQAVQGNGQEAQALLQDNEREITQNKIVLEQKQIEINELEKKLKGLKQRSEQKRASAPVKDNEQSSRRAQATIQDSEKARAGIQTQDSGCVTAQASTQDSEQGRSQPQTQVGNVSMSTEVGGEDRSGCGELWNFTCLLFNLGRNNHPIASSSHDGGNTDPAGTRTYMNTPETRKKLLQPVLDKEPDAIFLQETDRHSTVLNTLKSNYHVNSNQNCLVAVLLKKSMFETADITRSVLLGLLHHDIKSLYVKMMDDKEMKMCVCKATPLKRKNDSILMASYHARKLNFEKYCEMYTNLLKICQHLQDRIGARHLLIGGDFNTSAKAFEQALKDAGTMLSTQTQTNTTHRREHKRVIDYFIRSRHIECKSMKAQGFQSDIGEVDYSQLDCYFDHDPIFAEFSL